MSRRSAEGRMLSGSNEASKVARRTDQLVQIVDQCVEAKRVADALGEKLLSYLLAMAIQETRAAMRSEVEQAAQAPAQTLPRRVPRTRRT